MFREQVEEAEVLTPRTSKAWPDPFHSKGLFCNSSVSGSSLMVVGVGGWGTQGIAFSSQLSSRHALCLCSSGDRRDSRGHLDSDDAFPGTEPPARPAAPRREEDIPG